MWSGYPKMATKEVQVEVDDIRAIFRTLAPYIVRYWKDVSRELGLTDEDILDIEHVHPMARLSELSYQCLCMWHEKQGRNATKDKLSHALRNLELKRAEDAISHLVVRRGRVSSPSRRNSVAGPSTGASRGRRRSTGQPPPPSVPRKKTGVRKRNNSETLHKPKQGGLRRTSSEKTIQSSQGEADSANTAPRKDNREIGEVHATIEVSNIEMRPQSVESMETDQDGTDDRNQTSETEQDTFQKMMLHYYTNVVKNAQDHINALTTLLEFKDIYVKRLRLGSIVVILVCKSLRALLHLLDMYNKGELREACQKVFCTEKILRGMGISDLSVKVTIPQREIVRCKEELLSGRLGPSESSPNGSPAPRRAFSAPNSVSKLLIPQELNHRSRGAYLASLKAFQKQTKEDVRTLSQRYRTFEKCIKEFMLTLQLIRSGDLGPVKNISQLEKCNDFLKTSQSIGKQVRTDLVQEFLTMLSVIRVTVRDLDEKIAEMEMVFGQPWNVASIRSLKLMISGIEEQLSPEYNFSRLSVLLAYKLSILEKRLFAGLVSYVPTLLNRLTEVDSYFVDLLKQLSQKSGQSAAGNTPTSEEDMEI